MASNKEINLKITSDSLRKFCQEIAIGSSNTNRKHAAYMALEAFISRHAGADAHTQAYYAAQAIVEEFSTTTRAQLLAENASSLTSALANQKLAEVARVFSSVSRNGFNQIFLQALEDLSRNQLFSTKKWVADWCTSARQQAQQASGYPDAMNFHDTDIGLIEYTAMSEVNKLLVDI